MFADFIDPFTPPNKFILYRKKNVLLFVYNVRDNDHTTNQKIKTIKDFLILHIKGRFFREGNIIIPKFSFSSV